MDDGALDVCGVRVEEGVPRVRVLVLGLQMKEERLGMAALFDTSPILALRAAGMTEAPCSYAQLIETAKSYHMDVTWSSLKCQDSVK